MCVGPAEVTPPKPRLAVRLLLAGSCPQTDPEAAAIERSLERLLNHPWFTRVGLPRLLGFRRSFQADLPQNATLVERQTDRVSGEGAEIIESGLSRGKCLVARKRLGDSHCIHRPELRAMNIIDRLSWWRRRKWLIGGCFTHHTLSRLHD